MRCCGSSKCHGYDETSRSKHTDDAGRRSKWFEWKLRNGNDYEVSESAETDTEIRQTFAWRTREPLSDGSTSTVVLRDRSLDDGIQVLS